MDSSVQGLGFLDLTDISENEVGELNNVLFGEAANCAVILPWTPPPHPIPQGHWGENVIHQTYPATVVPPMVGGVQPAPPPLGHAAGPPWVTLPPPNPGEEAVNGTEEPVDGVPLIHSTVSTTLYPIIHPQPSVIVGNVPANVHSFQRVSYPVYPNAAELVPDVQNAGPRRQRSTKIAKRADNPVRRSIDSQANFTSQHQFSPNAPPYIPAHTPVPPATYSYYQPTAPPAGIPSPQAMAGSPLYLHSSAIQFPPPLMISAPYPPVYTTPPLSIEQQEVKEPVPYPPQQEHTIAVSLASPILPIVQAHLSATIKTTSKTSVSDVQVSKEIPHSTGKEEEDEDIPVVSTVIENSKLNNPPANNDESKPEKFSDSAVEQDGPSSLSAATPLAATLPPTKPPFSGVKEQKPAMREDACGVTPISPNQTELPSTPNQSTWASHLFGSPADGETKPTATVKPTLQNQPSNSTLPVTLNDTNYPSVSVSNKSLSRKSAPIKTAGVSKGLPLPCMSDDPHLLELGNYLVNYQLEHKPAALQPRGLTNRSNYCYINATLQALLACPPFYNLMKAVSSLRGNKITNSKGKSFTPIIDSIVKFINEFDEMSSTGNLIKTRREKAQARKDDQTQAGGVDIATGPSFEPTYVYKMLNVIRNDTAFPVEGRQEDAEEFLSCLLNGLNDEMLELQKLVNNNLSNGEVTTNGELHQEHDGESGWKEVTNTRNRQAVTRRTEVAQSPLSQIFQGQLRSSVQRVGNESTDNIQPFFTLPLDIEKAQSVKEALDRMVGKDILEGVTCTKTNQEVEAWQQVTLEQLPLVLLLHLKCFDYKLHTCSKIIKTVEFPIDLKIEQKLMSTVVKNKKKSTGASGGKERQYKLFAVVYHDGKEATKGHYITDVFHVGYGVWVRYDDATVKSVSENQVLHPKSPRVPYLLYYRRQDTINVSQNVRSQKSDL